MSLLSPKELARDALLFPRVYRQFLDYQRRQYRRASILSFQRRHLRALLEHAVTAVPAYQPLRERVVLALGDPEVALRLFPFLKREGLRDGFEDHCADSFDPERCFMTHTSGTSGMPIAIIHDEMGTVHASAGAMRRRAVYADPLAQRSALLVMRGAYAGKPEVTVDATQGLAIRAVFDLLRPDKTHATEVLDHLRQFEPISLEGRTSLLIVLAALYQEAGQSPPDSLKALFCGSEQLFPHSRRVLETCFGAPVFDAYGLRETGVVAWECEEHASYHIDEERLVVEIVDESGRPLPPGTKGEIVVTALFNRTMPIIRYRTGDAAALCVETCPCGRQLVRLMALEGRTPALLRLADGRRLNPELVKGVLDLLPLVYYQIVQRTAGEVTVRIVPAGDPGGDPLEQIKAGWRRRAGRPEVGSGLLPTEEIRAELERALPPGLAVKVEVVTVGQLRDPNGKIRVCIIEVGD